MQRRYDLYLRDMLRAIENISDYTEGLSFDDFSQRKMVIDAVLRNLEIIGEAVGKLPEQLKKDNPAVPWKEVKNFRNIVAHKYWKLDLDLVWDIIANELKPLATSIQELLKEKVGRHPNVP